ncbi:hypothetical protein OXYTRIMIC_543 [Oxytricha trifallax]|uniref:Uncharacterized protein n=1 Tax=Oxytricha trifallax TaxID=1172189 RepID=A0A073HZV9_9SPIT|nr:hypothetical protein OXYTRIMIC_543 [Oxytricha trifallax]
MALPKTNNRLQLWGNANGIQAHRYSNYNACSSVILAEQGGPRCINGEDYSLYTRNAIAEYRGAGTIYCGGSSQAFVQQVLLRHQD